MASRAPVRIFVLVSSITLGLVHIQLSRPQHMTRSKTRACYANQKTIVGAMEMYNLDKNTRRTELDAAFLHDLEAQKYLPELPDDPGQGPRSVKNYRAVDRGNGITCVAHGSIQ